MSPGFRPSHKKQGNWPGISRHEGNNSQAIEKHFVGGRHSTVKDRDHVDLLGDDDYDPHRFNYRPDIWDLVRKTPPVIRSPSSDHHHASVLSQEGAYLMPLVDPSWAIVCMLLAFIVGLVGGVRLTISNHYSNSNRMMR